MRPPLDCPQDRFLYLDTETYSSRPLGGTTGVGVYAYAEADDATVTLCAYAVGDGPVKVLEEYGTDPSEAEEWEHLIAMLRNGVWRKVAHNAAFDRILLSRVCGLPPGEYLDPGQWEDTMHLAARLGLPRGLGDLAHHLGVEEKDSAGHSLIRRFAEPWPATKSRGPGRIWPHQDPDRWQEYRRYCAQDVETLRAVHRTLRADPLHPGLDAREHDVEIVSERISDRGMPLDRGVLDSAMLGERRSAASARRRMEELTGLDNPSSVQQLVGWLAARMTDPPATLRRETLVDLLDSRGDLESSVREVLELRIEAARAAGRKLVTADRTASSGDRVRGALRYLGAHTGRWAGRGFQPQNLPREPLPAGETVESTVGRIEAGETVPATSVAALVRSCIAGPLAVADYTSIEAYVLAWLAGEQWVLDAYRDRRDLYVETAQRMTEATGRREPLTRQQGKVATLALGYGGGIAAMRAMARGQDLGDDETVRDLVGAWRAANPRIVALWDRLGREFRSGGPLVERIDRDPYGQAARVLRLPSGRGLVYRGVRPATDRWGRPSVSFWDPVRRAHVETYGGRLTENLVQAVARDVLADALVRLDREGYRTVAHVHDEVLVEGEPGWLDPDGTVTDGGRRAFERMRRLMEEAPLWAPADTWCLRAEGGIVDRYRKLSESDEIER